MMRLSVTCGLRPPCPLPIERRQSRQNNRLSALNVSKGCLSVLRHSHLVWDGREQAFIASSDFAPTQTFLRNDHRNTLRVPLVLNALA